MRGGAREGDGARRSRGRAGAGARQARFGGAELSIFFLLCLRRCFFCRFHHSLSRKKKNQFRSEKWRRARALAHLLRKGTEGKEEMALSSWRRRRRTPPLPAMPTTGDASSAALRSASSPPLAPAATATAAAAAPSPSPSPDDHDADAPRNALAFWLLGLANNSPYTIALAAANELAAGAVGSVFLAAVFPALLLKLTTPFWFPRVPVGARAAASALMALTAFPLLAAATRGGGAGAGGGTTARASSVLAPIALLSLQGGLGEASALAAAGSYPRPRVVLGAWSSGTGAAGPVGFSFLMLFHVFAKLSLRDTMLLALLWPALWLISQFLILRPPPRPDAGAAAAEGAVIVVGGGGGGGAAASVTAGGTVASATIELSPVSPPSRPLSAAAANRAATLDPEEAQGLLTPRAAEGEEAEDEERGRAANKAKAKAEGGTATAAAALPPSSSSSSSLSSSASPRWAATSLPRGFVATSAHVASLWPFAVPLFLVYFAGK